MKSPESILKISGEVSLEKIREAYGLALQSLVGVPAESALEKKEEVDWAFRELMSQLQAGAKPPSSAGDEETVLSAALLPGLNRDFFGDNASFAGDKNGMSPGGKRYGATSTLDSESAPMREESIPRTETLKRQNRTEPATAMEAIAQMQAQTHYRLPYLEPVAKGSVQVRADNVRDANVRARLIALAETAENWSGSFLKQLREEAAVSLEELHAHTKIAMKYLMAMENDDAEELPAPVYFRGFVVSYLKYLGIDKSEIIETVTRQYVTRLRKRAKPE